MRSLARERMNIGLVVHRYSLTEGTGGYVAALAERMARDHEVTVYSAAVETPLPDGVSHVHVPANLSTAYAAILSFPRAFETVRGPHDLVHSQGWTSRDADVCTAHIVLRAWRRAAGWSRLGRGERWLGWYVERRERALMNRARAVIAPSHRAQRDIEACYGRKEGVHVVYHGFPPPLAPAGETHDPISGAPLRALYVGDGRKGLDVAIRALTHCGANLLVASHSPEERYARLARDIGVRDRVEWLGPQNNMRTVYRRCDVLVHPSVYDTFGMAVSEAMSAGRPVVVSDRCGVAELIDNGRSGRVMPTLDPAAWGAELERLARDRAILAAMSGGATSIAREFSWDRALRATLEVYDTVQHQKKGAI